MNRSPIGTVSGYITMYGDNLQYLQIIPVQFRVPPTLNQGDGKMSLIQKVEFDAAVRKASPLEVVGICIKEVERIYRESDTIGGRKWAFSQYRSGWSEGKDLMPPRGFGVERAQYGVDVGTAVLRLASKVDHDILKSMVILALMRLDANDNATYRDEQKDTVVKDQDMTRARRAIVDVDRFVEIGESLLDGQSYLSRILGLCAVTGRRTVEIGTTAVFDWIDPNHVQFTGQAKTRGRTDVRPYAIPTLTDAGKVIDTLASIRHDKPELVEQPDLFHNRCVKDLYTRARVFGEVFSDGTAKPKDLRPAWVEIAWLLFDERQTGKALFLSRMLGHGDQDLMTAQSYDDFLIRDPAYMG